MPDALIPTTRILEAFAQASLKVEDTLRRLGSQPVWLGEAGLAAYPLRAFKTGWRIPVGFTDAERRLDLLLPPGFPWKAPRIALVDRPPFLTWPHIEHDGLLCLAPSNLEIDPSDPAGTAICLLGESCDLIEKLRRGECKQDFADEFLSYWGLSADYQGGPIISLIEPRPPSRRIRIWRGKTQYLIGEDESVIAQWLVNRFGSKPAGFRTETGAYFWLGPAPMPNEYPRSARELRTQLVKAGGGSEMLLNEVISTYPDKLMAIVAVSTTSGPALGAVILTHQAKREYGPREPLTKGFRPGNVPQNIMVERYFSGANLRRGEIERADAAWIHGRGEDDRASVLRHKTIAIIGCGSIGAPIAIALAQAGIGRLLLIDNDILVWANVGRHPLGAAHVGDPKATALAKRMRTDFPHTTIKAHVADGDSIIRENSGILDQCDLIVSATGSWALDSLLDAWQQENHWDRPIIYAWTEPHACAGHAVVIGGKGDGLGIGFDATGRPLLRVTRWPQELTQRRLPACGAVYQPYGPIELGFINSLASELALDTLLREEIASIHRIWAGSQRRLRSLGGEWSAEWLELTNGHADGGFILEKKWGVSGSAPDTKAIAA